MRRQDELLALMPISDAPTRRYILAQVPGLPIHFDSDDAAHLLAESRRAAEPRVATQAIWAWHEIGPAQVLFAHGLDEQRLGMWSELALHLRGGPAVPLADIEAPDSGPQRTALAAVLEPCRAAVLEAAARAGAEGDLAREILGLVPFTGWEDVLRDGARDPGRALTALLALSRLSPSLAAAALTRERRVPLHLRMLAAGTVEGPAVRELAVEAVKSGDEPARWAAALALPQLALADAVALGRALAQADPGWTQVAVLDALGQMASDSPIPPDAQAAVFRVLDHGLRHAQHDLVRIAAVRAMGALKVPDAVRRAKKCLERGSPFLQAVSIETLTRAEHSGPEFIELLLDRAATGPAKLRGVAVLGLMRLDREQALQRAFELVRGNEPAHRIEGAYVLGYVQSRTSLEVLATLARHDPFPPAAIQAQKSMAYYTEAEAAPRLMDLIDDPRPDVAVGAVRVLSHFAGEAQAELAKKLSPLAARLSREALRTCLASIGRLGPAVRGVSALLAESARGEGALGALEGLCHAGEVPAEVARAAAESADPAVAARGAAALLIAGDTGGAAALGKLLTDAKSAPAALACVRELAVIAGEAGRGGRFASLRALLGNRTRATVAQMKARPRAVVRPSAPAPVVARDTPEALRTCVGIDREGLLDDMKKKLVALSDRTAKSGREWALDLTYLQGQGLALISRARALAHPALLVAVAVAGLVSMLVSAYGNASSGPLRAADPATLDPALVVSGVVGQPQRVRTGATAPLAEGERVEPGDIVRTAAAQKAALDSRAGVSVLVFPTTELKVPESRAAARPGVIAVELVRGAVVVDTRIGGPTAALHLRTAAAELEGKDVSLRASLENGALTVHVVRGKARLTSRTGKGEVELAPRQRSGIAPTGEPTAVAPFAVTDVVWR